MANEQKLYYVMYQQVDEPTWNKKPERTNFILTQMQPFSDYNNNNSNQISCRPGTSIRSIFVDFARADTSNGWWLEKQTCPKRVHDNIIFIAC